MRSVSPRLIVLASCVGIYGSIVLGLGRALGETMAIALIISPSLKFWVSILTDSQNSQTIAANLALNFPESNPLQREALIGTGLMLFVISLAVNFVARGILTRTGRGAKRRKASGGTPPVDISITGNPTSDAAVEAIEAAEALSPADRARRDGAS